MADHPIVIYAEKKFDEAVADFKNSKGSPKQWRNLRVAMMRYQQVIQRSQEPVFDQWLDDSLARTTTGQPSWKEAIKLFDNDFNPSDD